MNNIKKYRSRSHCILLYPEDSSHVEAYEKIQKSYDYASILHDRDYTEDGEIKKPHIHVVVRTQNATWNSKLATDLGIDLNYIQDSRSYVNSLLYLIHFNDSDKAQYSIDDVKGTLKTNLAREISKVSKTEDEKAVDIFDYIKSYDGYLSFSKFSEFCLNNGFWSDLRRASAIWGRLVDEHNIPYRNDKGC